MSLGPHTDDHAQERAEIRAIRVAITCSVIGVAVKLAAGVVTGSMAMLSSAADSLGDLFVSVANLLVVRYGHQPPDEDHNYGHAKIEGLGAMFEGGFILAAAVVIFYEAARRMWLGEARQDTTLGIVVMVPMLLMTIGTVTYLRKVARETGSLVIKSDALHYATDVWVNAGVLVSLVLVRLTGKPIIDALVSIGIAVFMVSSSLKVVREGFDVVMDKSLPADVVHAVARLLEECTRIESFHDLRTRGGKFPHVDFHVVVHPAMTAREVHDLYDDLKHRVRQIAGPATRVHLHADPSKTEPPPAPPPALAKESTTPSLRDAPSGE